MSCKAAKKKKLKESSLVHGRWFCFQEMDTHLEQPHTGPARGGGGQRADQAPPDLPQQNFFQQKQWNASFLMDLWCFAGVLWETRGGVRRPGPGCTRERRWVGEEPGRGTQAKPPNKGRGRWKALSARSALITRQNSSRLGRKRSYVHKSTKD